MTKAEIVTEAAKSALGSPYVFGAWGQECTTATRRKYAGYNPDHRNAIYNACPQLARKQSDCKGCKYEGKRAFDCRGFTHWCLLQAGIDIAGSGATSQYNTASNWVRKGSIDTMPDAVCCVFKRSGNTMQHTGLHIGGGIIIHCSAGVQYGKITDSGWTDYAIPAGLYEEGEISDMVVLRKGSRGDAVKKLQEKLCLLRYDCGTPDGVFGAHTYTAVLQFQQDFALNQDGIAGEKTQKALDSAVSRQVSGNTVDRYDKSEEQMTPEDLYQLVLTAIIRLEAIKLEIEEILEMLEAACNE